MSDLSDRIIEQIGNPIRRAQAEAFKDGWKAGCADALRLALGQESSGAQPYQGPLLPSEFRTWARRALTKLDEA